MIANLLKTSLAHLVHDRPFFFRRYCRRKTMVVVCYHRIQADVGSDGLALSPDDLDRHLRLVAESRSLLNVSAARFENIWRGKDEAAGRIPLLITFDDGYRDNLLYAAPLLRKYGLTALLFLTTDVLAQRPLWYDLLRQLLASAGGGRLRQELAEFLPAGGRRICADDFRGWVAAIKDLPPAAHAGALARLREIADSPSRESEYFTVADLRAWLAMGMDIGCHTRTHPRLSRLSREEARAEIGGSKADLEKVIGSPVKYFAYPFGGENDFTPENAQDLEMLGLSMGFSLVSGSNRAGDNPYLIRRNCLDAEAGKTLLRGISPATLQMEMLGFTSDIRRRWGRWLGKNISAPPILPPAEKPCP